jgi:hypothetical protein
MIQWTPAATADASPARPSAEALADGIACFVLNLLRARLLAGAVCLRRDRAAPGPRDWHAAEILRREA